jgi:hypothetical protein
MRSVQRLATPRFSRADLAKMRDFSARRWHVLAQLAEWYRRGEWVDLTMAAASARRQRQSIAGLGSSSPGRG